MSRSESGAPPGRAVLVKSAVAVNAAFTRLAAQFMELEPEEFERVTAAGRR